MSSTAHREIAASPALSALIVYLRPLPRAELLPKLAELGIFVTEAPSRAKAHVLARGTRPDIIVLVGTGADHELARELQSAADAALVAILPADASRAEFVDLGAECVSDEDICTTFQVGLARAGRKARLARGRQAAAGRRSWEHVEFNLDPPGVMYQGRGVALDRAETICLLRLWQSAGLPVASRELRESLEALEPGYSGIGDEAIDAVVNGLRRKIAKIGQDPGALATVDGFGYVLLS